MGNIIEDIYHDLKEGNYETPPKAVWVPSYLTCSKVIVGNPAPDITVKSRYAIQNLDTAYYTTFKINPELGNE